MSGTAFTRTARWIGATLCLLVPRLAPADPKDACSALFVAIFVLYANRGE